VFSPAQTQGSAKDQARGDKRSHLLKIHQRVGLIDTAPLIATVVSSSVHFSLYNFPARDPVVGLASFLAVSTEGRRVGPLLVCLDHSVAPNGVLILDPRPHTHKDASQLRIPLKRRECIVFVPSFAARLTFRAAAPTTREGFSGCVVFARWAPTAVETRRLRFESQCSRTGLSFFALRV
jgi:hypothetical protein